MLIVSCQGCGRVALLDCPEAHDGGARSCGDPRCQHTDPDYHFDLQQPQCNAEGKCCHLGHTEPHRSAQKACPNNAEHGQCDKPDGECSFALMEAEQGRDKSCPGHCGPHNGDSCNACRPLTIIVPPGHGPTLRPVAGG